MLVATALHEVGHGLVLASYGGAPRRIGVMLFYLTPAFFCDISDGWRLPSPRFRVHVAVAGILVQGSIGAAFALAALLPVPADARDGLLVLAIATFIACLLNTLPFVKLDGYIALMSWLDVPHLRDKAISDARGALSAVLFGVRLPRALPQYRWAAIFGFACLIMPVLLVVNALVVWSDTLIGLGVVGSLIMGVIIAIAATGLARELGRTVRDARRAGAGLLRIAGITGMATAAVVASLVVVPVPDLVVGGYRVDRRGGAELVLPTSANISDVTAGIPVRLEHAGLVVSTTVGVDAVGAGRPIETQGSLASFLPVRDDDMSIPVPVVVLPLVSGATPLDRGRATVELGDVPLWRWITGRVIGPFANS